MHADVGEEFLACVLQACAEDIDRIVDNQKTIVVVLADVDSDRRILLLLLLDEADDVGVGIKDLSVVEDTLHGWQRRAHEEVNLVFQVYLPSAAVSKDSLRTAESTNSPSLKILPIWRVMLMRVCL